MAPPTLKLRKCPRPTPPAPNGKATQASSPIPPGEAHRSLTQAMHPPPWWKMQKRQFLPFPAWMGQARFCRQEGDIRPRVDVQMVEEALNLPLPSVPPTIIMKEEYRLAAEVPDPEDRSESREVARKYHDQRRRDQRLAIMKEMRLALQEQEAVEGFLKHFSPDPSLPPEAVR